jgi:hypothetical protein
MDRICGSLLAAEPPALVVAVELALLGLVGDLFHDHLVKGFLVGEAPLVIVAGLNDRDVAELLIGSLELGVHVAGIQTLRQALGVQGLDGGRQRRVRSPSALGSGCPHGHDGESCDQKPKPRVHKGSLPVIA